MLGNLFRSRKASRPERATFKPFLESLESREVPSCAQTSAVFNALPTDMNNLVASATNRNINELNTNINTVASNMFQLHLGAPGFNVGDRLRIDSTLITDGIVLIYQGYLNFPFITVQPFENMVQLGGSAIRAGLQDFLIAGFFPGTSGNCVLT